MKCFTAPRGVGVKWQACSLSAASKPSSTSRKPDRPSDLNRSLLNLGGLHVCSAAARSSSLVSVEWVQCNLEDVSILDCRVSISEGGAISSGHDQYLEGHIPGSVHVNILKDGVVQDGAVKLLQKDQGEFAAIFERKGLTAERPVVVYDSGDGVYPASAAASRVWWQLLCHGHPEPLLLSGGWQAWDAAGGESELFEPCPLKLMSYFEGVEPRWQHCICAVDLKQLLSSGGGVPQTLVVDFREDINGSEALDTIPQAIHLPLSKLLKISSGSCQVMTPEALASVLAEAAKLKGVDFGRSSLFESVGGIILVCHDGLVSCQAGLAMSELRFTNWAVLDGGLMAWHAQQ